MNELERKAIVKKLTRAFDDALDVTPAEGQPLHVLLPQLELPPPWKPSPTRGLTIWKNWPADRPEFYIDWNVTGETNEPPRSNSSAFLLGESWRAFSFTFAWSGDDPVRVVQLWLTRFISEKT